MGIFFKRKKIFNRAPIDVGVFFDGQRDTIPPGHYDLPEQTIYFAKNQNPIMGSGDAQNPHMSGTKYLIVEEEEDGYGVPLTKDEWEAHLKRPCRIDEEAAFAEKYQDEPKARLVVRGKGRVAAQNRYEATQGVRLNPQTDFTNKDA